MSTGTASLERPAPYRPRMPRLNRAKLFAPYDALKPFESTVHAKDTVYTRRIELSEYAQESLDHTLRCAERGDTVTVTWFIMACSSGQNGDMGQYVTAKGVITNIDRVFHVLYLGNAPIPMKDILCLQEVDEDAQRFDCL